jgi:MFS family permease
LLVVMANTSLTVAAPSMTRSLGLSGSQLEWVVDAYLVVYAGLMLVSGAIGDRLGHRGALLAGLAVFAAAAVWGSQASSAGELIAARAVMGAGAALIMPATLSLLGAIFPRRERAAAITAWSATSGIAIAVGPLLAGWILRGHG